MRQSLSNFGSQKNLKGSSNFLQDMQKSQKRRHLGLSQKSFSNQKDMEKHVWYMHLGTHTHQGASCSTC